MTEQTQRQSTLLAARDADISVNELWLHYYSVGGNLTAFEVDAYLHGVHQLPVGERNTIAWALNELIADRPLLGCSPVRRTAELTNHHRQD